MFEGGAPWRRHCSTAGNGRASHQAWWASDEIHCSRCTVELSRFGRASLGMISRARILLAGPRKHFTKTTSHGVASLAACVQWRQESDGLYAICLRGDIYGCARDGDTCMLTACSAALADAQRHGHPRVEQTTARRQALIGVRGRIRWCRIAAHSRAERR